MPRLRRLFISLATTGPALLCLALAAGPAAANIDGGLKITAVAANGDMATFELQAPSGATSWSWSSTQPIELRSPTSGDLLGVINPNGGQTSIGLVDDPVILLNFTVQAGASETSFMISSALLSFTPLTAEGRATVGMSLTDSDGNGAALTGIGDPAGSQGAYLAQYNGFAGTVSGTTFAELIPTMSAGVFSSDVESGEVPLGGGFQSIATPVSDMSVLVSFRLSAFDQASGTSTYVIQQQPTPVVSTTWGRIKSLY